MKIITLCFFLNMQLAYARTDCDIQRYSQIENEYFITSGQSVDCDVLSEIHQAISDTSNFYKVNEKISLAMVYGGFDVSFDLGHIITLPQNFTRLSVNSKLYKVKLENMKYIAAHEYAHVILHRRLMKDLSGFNLQTFDLINELSFHKRIIQDLSFQLRKRKIPLKKIKATVNKIKKSNTYLKIARKKLFALKGGINIGALKPYHELYADTLAVYLYNEPDAFNNALFHPNYNIKERMINESRSFLLNTDYKLEDNHSKFAKVRQYIGKNLWPSSQQEAIKYSEVLYNVILDEIKLTLTTKRSHSKQVLDILNRLKKRQN